ncbi:MAG TPA: glycosyl hydrolase family 28-related protein [Luteolibacter sp.]|nr:glycosyl hydrolase family 28-related protein [Luteolibacter sp.]
MRPRSAKIRFQLTLLAIVSAGLLPCLAWWPSLYPENWTPPDSASFTSDKLIQDFSYAGYRRGGEPVPEVAGPVFDAAASYGADPTGASDSTAAIQAAIDAAALAGGGVVLLPAGTYLVEPQGGNNHALQISSSNIVLRGAGVGQTFVLNTSYLMRAKAIIRIAPPSTTLGDPVAITADLDNPTRRIPVADASAFDVGDVVRLEWTFTQDWIDEHNQGTWWTAPDTVPAPAQYLREVTAVDTVEGWIEVDSPTRYTMKPRDNALVRTMSGHLTGVGIEDLSIGNVQHPGSTFAEGAYTTPGTAAYEVHASWALSMQDCYDSWITGVESFQAAGNTTTCHILSNGISLLRSFRVTVADCAMRRSQYGGGGGNGYMFRIQSSHDNMIQDSVADFARHGIVLSHAGTSGNVFLRCEDRETQRSTGSTGSYTTGGSGSDHHMHFTHSNLFDQCHAFNSFYTAHHRTSIGTIAHGLTSAHGVYWNTSGSGTRGAEIVRSEQARYGYVIGTSGTRSSVSTPTGGNTSPADHVEGVGMGETLEPASLYLDQLAKRAQGILLSVGEGGTIPPSFAFPLNVTAYSYGSGPISYQWSQLSGPTATIADATSPTTTVEVLENGSYVFELSAVDGALSNSAQLVLTVDDSIVDPTVTAATLVSVDGIVGRSQINAPAPGYYVGDNGTTVGCTGSDVEKNREDRNVIYRYALPTLPTGETPTAFTFSFQITALRDHDNKDFQLHAYLLDVPDPTITGADLFYHGPNDINHAFVGSHFEFSGANTGSIILPSPVDVTFTIDSGAALTLLQSYYTGNVPNRTEAALRFNLDQLFPNDALTGNALNRYLLNHAANGLQIQSIPGPGITFDDWIAGFDVGALTGFNDDPDSDGIPNGLEAWFGTFPDEFSAGPANLASDGPTSTFTHPRNPEMPTDLSGFYEWSPDLIDWYRNGGGPEGGPTVGFAAETVDGTTTVTATASGELGRIFLRAAVSRN